MGSQRRQLGLTASIQLVYPFIRRCQGISFEDSNKKKIMADKKNIIPVKLGDFSVLDSEFNSIRERFDAEMRKMEDEMTKFRSELLNREQSSVFSKSSTTTSSSSSTTSSNANANALAAPTSSDWLTGLHSPLIQEDGEEKKLKLRFDVSQYTPEEIVVKTVDQKLLVTIESVLFPIRFYALFMGILIGFSTAIWVTIPADELMVMC